MTKFLKHIAIFILFSAVIYVALIIAWGEIIPKKFKNNLSYKIGSYGHTYTRLQELDSVKNVDIIFLGSSHTYRGFDNEIFRKHGISSFNLGSSGQSIIQTEYLINKYLNQLNPKTVIFEVYPSNFSSDGIGSSIDLMSNGNINIGMVNLLIKQKHIKQLNTFIYSTYQEIIGEKQKFK